MISNVVMPGYKMDLIKLQNSRENEGTPKTYKSQVLDLMDEETAKISMPVEGSRVIPLEVGDQYRFCFYTPNGLFQCRGEVVERYKEGKLAVLMVRFDSELEKYQRRQYYRLEYVMATQFHIITKDEILYEKRMREDAFRSPNEKKLCSEVLKEMKGRWNDAKTLDISGGGCRFLSAVKLEAEDHIQVKIHYTFQGSDKNSIYECRVISSEEVEKRRGFYETRVEFQRVDAYERETLIKFIFEEERKIRQRERGLP